MPYYNNRKMRLAPEADNLQALFAEAEILAGSTNQQGQPKMVELIDTIMSIPSCIQVNTLIYIQPVFETVLKRTGCRTNNPRLTLSTNG